MGGPFGQHGRSWPPVPRLWAGSAVFILGGGPSLWTGDVERVREYIRGQAQAETEGAQPQTPRVIAVNNAFRLALWADLLYACDRAWWDWYASPGDGGLSWSDFQGMRVTIDPHVAEAHRVGHESGAPGLCRSPLRLHGNNSGYQAINLAYHLGASRIALLGFDMQRTGGQAHWHGDHPAGLNNAQTVDTWVQYFDALADDLAQEGVSVVNCSRETALRCFPCMELNTWLKTLSA